LSLRVKVILIRVFLCLALGATVFAAIETFQDVQPLQQQNAFFLLKLLPHAAKKRTKQAITSISTVVDLALCYLKGASDVLNIYGFIRYMPKEGPRD